MTLVDPGDPSTWPDDVAHAVQALVARCRGVSSNSRRTLSYELRLESPDAAAEEECRFRALLGRSLVPLYHATRLLPHEIDGVHRKGLMVLSEEHRSERLDAAIEIYTQELDRRVLESLRSSGPLSWDRRHRAGRLGFLWGVTPLEPAFACAGRDLMVFLERWGGESFYWSSETVDTRAAIARLTERSIPLIIEVGVEPRSLNAYTKLWPIFVSTIGGWRDPYHEFNTRQSVAPDRVLDIIDESSPRWPYRANVGDR